MENKRYSVAYFDHVAVFSKRDISELQLRTGLKRCCVDTYAPRMSAVLNGNSEIQHFERSDDT